MKSSEVTDGIEHDAVYALPDWVAVTHEPLVPHRTENGTATFLMVKVAVVVIVRPEVGSVPVATVSTNIPSRHAAVEHVGLSEFVAVVTQAEAETDASASGR